eukprot:m.803632 g.803632  ORF g.803632 m.803632 type:complete len:229 (-) comp23367_c0_seq5:25-711(-)
MHVSQTVVLQFVSVRCPLIAGSYARVVQRISGARAHDTMASTHVCVTCLPARCRSELRDPFHQDFRPCPTSRVASLGVGAYQIVNTSQSGDVYWIPGRQLMTAISTPLPPPGSIAVHVDTALMFNQARRASAHVVYAAPISQPLARIATVAGDANVVHPFVLHAYTDYHWRVDVVVMPTASVPAFLARGIMPAAAEIYPGTVWTFTTGATRACAQPVVDSGLKYFKGE